MMLEQAEEEFVDDEEIIEISDDDSGDGNVIFDGELMTMRTMVEMM